MHNWNNLLRKCARRGRYSQWRSLLGHVERIFNVTALRTTQTNLHSMFCALFLKIALSAAELMSFGHFGTAILHRWTIVCKVPSKISVTPTIDALKDNIREAVGEIQLHTIDNVLKNWIDCVGYFMASRGSQLHEIIFHYYPGSYLADPVICRVQPFKRPNSKPV